VAAARLSDHHRTAFITGASTGLGRAFADHLADAGLRVWGTSRDPARLVPLAARHGDRFVPLALELADGPGAERAFLAADAAAGGFDLVINNAGYGVFAEFAGTDFATWEDQINVMLVQPARLSHAALRVMRPRGRGTLVNISSLAAEFPLPFQSGYNVVKAGLSALSESLITETAGSGLHVLDVRPGDYRTDFEGSVRRPQANLPARAQRAWEGFRRLMAGGPDPAHAARQLERALLARRSGTVRIGRCFQARIAPLLSGLAPQGLRRAIQDRYFGL
jgi:short-subunit dehydrogenase